jgi:hypothetical protein
MVIPTIGTFGDAEDRGGRFPRGADRAGVLSIMHFSQGSLLLPARIPFLIWRPYAVGRSVLAHVAARRRPPAAVAAGLAAGVPPDAVAAALATSSLSKWRMELRGSRAARRCSTTPTTPIPTLPGYLDEVATALQ